MKDEEKQLVIDYHVTFGGSGASGERVLENLKTYSGYNDRILPNSPEVMAFELGRRDLFLHILDKLNIDPYAESQPSEQIIQEIEDAW